jgi:hypothetical protein
MIDPVSLGIGIVIGAVVGIGGGIWFVKRKLRTMQENMFGGMGGMMQDPSTQQEQPDMEAVMGDMMDMMETPEEDSPERDDDGLELGDGDLELDDDEVDWKQ